MKKLLVFSFVVLLLICVAPCMCPAETAAETSTFHRPAEEQSRIDQTKAIREQGKPAEALELLQGIKQDYPDDGLVYYHMGRCQAAMGRIRESVASYETAINLAGPVKDDSTVRLSKRRIAETYRQLKKYDEALKVYADLQNSFPELGVLWQTEMSHIYADKGDDVKVEESLKKAIELAVLPRDKDYMVQAKRELALFYEHHGRFAPEIEIYRQLMTDKPEMTPNWKLWSAACYRYQGKYADAMAILNDLTANATDWSKGSIARSAVLDTAECFFLQGKSAEGEAYLDGVLKDHSDLKAWVLYGKGKFIALFGQDKEKAVLLLKEFVSTYPNEPGIDEGKLFLVTTVRNLGRLDEAVELVRTICSSGDAKKDLITMANVYYDMKKYQEAIPYFERARDLASLYGSTDELEKSAFALFSLAWCYWETGDKDAARETMQSVVDKYPQTGSAENAKRQIASWGAGS